MPIVASPVNGFWKRRKRGHGVQMCLSALSQARLPIFYEKWGVADTLEGRFDCACLHIVLLLKHTKGTLGQAIFDAFFGYTELTLRELGVGDLSVGKQVKKCAKFFYGALKAYTEALDAETGLEEALSCNLFGGVPPPSLQDLVAYIQNCDQLLKGQDFDQTSFVQWP